MGNIFAGSEVVELGVEIEKNGRDFYNALSTRTNNLKAKSIFSFLAGEETKHIRAFEEILNKTKKYEPQGIDSDDYFAYMNSLASEHVFTKKNTGKEAALKASDDKSAVGMAIGFEKDSIVFYEGIKKIVPADEGKIVDELIAQEGNHLKQLLDFEKML